MMAKILTIDFETCDPYLTRKMGSGWVYGCKVPTADFEVLGAAVRTHKGTVYYETDFTAVANLVESHDVLIMHNAQYDLGCMRFLEISYENKVIFDTEVMSRLFNSSLERHGLDYIAKRYLGIGKSEQSLTDALWEHNLYPWLKREIKEREKSEKLGVEYIRQRPDEKKLVLFAKKNMKLVQQADPEAMAEYACGDVEPTYGLFNFFRKNGINMKQAKRYSALAKICIKYRLNGVRVDLKRAREVHDELVPIIASKFKEVYDIAGEEFNVASPIDMVRVFDRLKIKYPINTKTGNATMGKEWMLKQSHPLCKALVEAKKVLKIDRDFIVKIQDMQEWTCPDAGDYGRVYPELHLLRAKTGRFSCTSPNIQQIPSRDPVYSPMCRSLFVAEEGEKWFSLDYSNQEGRLQVHFAESMRCEGAEELGKAFRNNPDYDMHQIIADMVGITRTDAKAINLGLSYGMGIQKLAASLGLKVKDAEVIKKKYNKLVPFLDNLNKKCQTVLQMRGFIKTIGGRHSHIEPPTYTGGKEQTYAYKALNKKIQGSAADMIIEAMIAAYKEDIPVLFPVHDELCMSGTKEQARRLQKLMKDAVKLTIPVVVGMGKGGDSWATGDH